MYSTNHYKRWLTKRLEKKGLEKKAIPGFIWSVKSCVEVNPDLDRADLNWLLKLQGWDDFELDYLTFQLAIASFEAESRQPLMAVARSG